MKTNAELNAMPLNERIGWLIAEQLLSPVNAAVRATLKDALRA